MNFELDDAKFIRNFVADILKLQSILCDKRSDAELYRIWLLIEQSD